MIIQACRFCEDYNNTTPGLDDLPGPDRTSLVWGSEDGGNKADYRSTCHVCIMPPLLVVVRPPMSMGPSGSCIATISPLSPSMTLGLTDHVAVFSAR